MFASFSRRSICQTRNLSQSMVVDVQLLKLDVQPEVIFPVSRVGSLLFAVMVTRLDIANAVPQLNQHLCAFGEEHIAAVKRVMRDLRSNVTFKYGADGRVDMIGYVDLDHAGNHATFDDRLHLHAQRDGCHVGKPATK